MDTKRLAALAALTLLPFAAACGSEDAGSESVGAGAAASVTGVHWAVDGVTVDGKKSDAPSGAWLSIADGGKVKGNLGCNNFGADAAFADSHVTFDQVQATEMACEGVPPNFEQTLARTLADGDLGTEVDGDKLTLTTADGDRSPSPSRKTRSSTARSGPSPAPTPAARPTSRSTGRPERSAAASAATR